MYSPVITHDKEDGSTSIVTVSMTRHAATVIGTVLVTHSTSDPAKCSDIDYTQTWLKLWTQVVMIGGAIDERIDHWLIAH